MTAAMAGGRLALRPIRRWRLVVVVLYWSFSNIFYQTFTDTSRQLYHRDLYKCKCVAE